MNKEEFIRKYGEVAYEKKLQQRRDLDAQHREEKNTKDKEWRENNPEEVVANGQEAHRKGGKYYAHTLKYDSTGLRGKRNRIRRKHRHQYQPYKQIIAQESQIHHSWLPETADYTGVALVEADQHRRGYIDVIQILEGEITLLTEAEIRKGGL